MITRLIVWGKVGVVLVAAVAVLAMLPIQVRAETGDQICGDLAQYDEYVSQNMVLVNCNDLRDRKAISRLAAGFLKLLFPNMKPTEQEFKEYCVKPAVELRQRVRDELHKMDPEYAKVEIGYE